MRIDVHAHYWTDGYLDMLVDPGRSSTATQRGIGAGGGAELDARLRLMVSAGVDMQVLSAAPQLPYGDDAARAVAAACYVNDEYTALVSSHPDRFRAFAATPMPHIDAAVAEMCRAIDELGMVGVTMNTSILDRAITDPQFEPVFAELGAAPSCICIPSAMGRVRRWSATITSPGWLGRPSRTPSPRCS
ncbi:MAG: 6-methylsalicylate decarboxylase [Mycobacterium sp.]|jgi:aminocarboxymuconate-semialdehyde decarboxylase|nr:6-methylsalicylate decarboxylase [Mycobacterium sp.]